MTGSASIKFAFFVTFKFGLAFYDICWEEFICLTELDHAEPEVILYSWWDIKFKIIQFY